MSVDFFSRLASGTSAYILGGLAVGFELSKREAWRAFVWTKSPKKFALALGLTFFSIISAGSYILDQVDGNQKIKTIVENPRSIILQEITELDSEMSQFRTLQSQLKPEFRTTALQYSIRLEELRLQRRASEERLEILSIPAVQAGETLSLRLGQLLGIPNFSFWFWLGLIGLLEYGIIGTIPSKSQNENSVFNSHFRSFWSWALGGTSVGQTFSVVGTEVGSTGIGSGFRLEEFLSAAFKGTGKALRGRREVARKMGISEREVRLAMDKLQELNLIKFHYGDGFTLRMDISEALEKIRGEFKQTTDDDSIQIKNM